MIEQRTIWRFTAVWWAWRLWVRIRYALTGDCGAACGIAAFRDAQPPYTPVRIFVPECGCPIHDPYEGATSG